MNTWANKRSGSVRGFVIALSFCGVGSAVADEYHYTNILIGERAAGMGGAYTAVSDDPSGLFYNPAGIVYAPSSNISASVNAYNLQDKNYKQGLSGLSDWKRKSTTFVPNFFGIIQPVGQGVIGFSYAVPDSVTEDQDLDLANPASGISRYIINFNNDDRTYKIGPSYARAVNDRFSLGATLYFHYWARQWISNQLAILDNGSYQHNNTYFKTSEYGVEPMFGMMWSPVDKLALGLTASKTLLYSSSLASQLIVRDATTKEIAVTKNNSDEKRVQPLRLTAGAAYFPTSKLLLSMDVSHFSATRDATFGDRIAVTNVAFGVEYYLKPSLALRGGIYTDNANTPKLQSSLSNQREHIDLLGLSASVTRFTRNSSLTLGLNYASGDGHAQIVGGSNDIQNVTTRSVTVFMATSYNY
jgi:long-subunit fatty acid transport protein